MIIDGVQIAQGILESLKSMIKGSARVPKLAIVLVGNNESSDSYVRQKQKAALAIGAKIVLKNFPSDISYQKISKEIHDFSLNSEVDGIIIQRPLPLGLSPSALMLRIDKQKDVDGFLPKSHFSPPIGEAVLHLLASSLWGNGNRYIVLNEDVRLTLVKNLKSKSILLIGRGETAGKPIGITLAKYKIPYFNATSTTPLAEYAGNADIIISAVGRPNIVRHDILKKNPILISVGLYRGIDGKLHGDFNEKLIEKSTSMYTPTPGGIGPVNVACLMKNLVEAWKINQSKYEHK